MPSKTAHCPCPRGQTPEFRRAWNEIVRPNTWLDKGDIGLVKNFVTAELARDAAMKGIMETIAKGQTPTTQLTGVYRVSVDAMKTCLTLMTRIRRDRCVPSGDDDPTEAYFDN